SNNIRRNRNVLTPSVRALSSLNSNASSCLRSASANSSTINVTGANNATLYQSVRLKLPISQNIMRLAAKGSAKYKIKLLIALSIKDTATPASKVISTFRQRWPAQTANTSATANSAPAK